MAALAYIDMINRIAVSVFALAGSLQQCTQLSFLCIFQTSLMLICTKIINEVSYQLFQPLKTAEQHMACGAGINMLWFAASGCNSTKHDA